MESTDFTRKIDAFGKERKEKRRQEWETMKQFLSTLKHSKNKQFKQPDKEKGEVVYSQIAHDMEQTRDVMRRSLSRASTISAEDKQMALTEEEFSMIKRKMDKIDQ